MSNKSSNKSKLDAIRKHNASRLRYHQLKNKEKDEISSQLPEHIITEQQSTHQEQGRDSSSILREVDSINNVLIHKDTTNIHVQDSLTNLITDDKYKSHNDSSSSKKRLNNDHSFDDHQYPSQNKSLHHHQQQSQPTSDQNMQLISCDTNAESGNQLGHKQERELLNNEFDDMYTRSLFHNAHQQSLLLEEHEYSLQEKMMKQSQLRDEIDIEMLKYVCANSNVS